MGVHGLCSSTSAAVAGVALLGQRTDQETKLAVLCWFPWGVTAFLQDAHRAGSFKHTKTCRAFAEAHSKGKESVSSDSIDRAALSSIIHLCQVQQKVDAKMLEETGSRDGLGSQLGQQLGPQPGHGFDTAQQN